MKLFNFRILFVILTCMAIVNVSAQNYSELDLFGKWKLVQRNGDYDQEKWAYGLPKINNIKEMLFYDMSISYGKGTNNSENSHPGYSGEVWIKDVRYMIYQSFITNSNLLYITCCGRVTIYGTTGQTMTDRHIVLRFKILSLSNDRLELSTLDNACVLIFEKENSSSNVRLLHEETEVSSDYFNLQGIQLESQPQSGIYIEKSKGDKVKKVIGSKGAK